MTNPLLISTSLIVALALGCSSAIKKPTFGSKVQGADATTDGSYGDGDQKAEDTTDGTSHNGEDSTGDIETETPKPSEETETNETPVETGDGIPAIGTAGTDGYKLVWQDEFNSDKVDDSKWTFEVQKPGWVNNELQNYTNNRKENVRIEDGSLIIEARRDNFDGYEYSSGRIKTEGKAAWKYGKIEARIQLPGGVGTWPAFWMMPENQSRGWPACGEIDIMEQVGFETDTAHATTHTLMYNWANNNVKTASTVQSGITAGFHTYTLIWVAGKIEMQVDGRTYYTVTDEGKGDDAWPFNKEFHVILNLAVGGVWGGMNGVDSNIWPRQMKVDWVRVWQK